jgi:hypothetical protein
VVDPAKVGRLLPEITAERLEMGAEIR